MLESNCAIRTHPRAYRGRGPPVGHILVVGARNRTEGACAGRKCIWWAPGQAEQSDVKQYSPFSPCLKALSSACGAVRSGNGNCRLPEATDPRDANSAVDLWPRQSVTQRI